MNIHIFLVKNNYCIIINTHNTDLLVTGRVFFASHVILLVFTQ